MLSHLVDTLRLTLGDVRSTPVASAFRIPGVKHLVLEVLPWPKGRITGPPEAFTSSPGLWQHDRAQHEELLERFGQSRARTDWPPHPTFGPMSRRLWDRFTYRHLNHHFRQFGI